MKNIISLSGNIMLLVLISSITPVHSESDSAVPSSSNANVHNPQLLSANSEVKQAIVELMKQMSKGVENRNVDEIMEIFLASPDVILIGSKEGKIARGFEEVRNLFKGIVSSKIKTRLVWQSYTVNTKGDVAWLFASADLIHENTNHTSRVPYRVTGLFLRVDDQWKWVQYHGSEPIGKK